MKKALRDGRELEGGQLSLFSVLYQATSSDRELRLDGELVGDYKEGSVVPCTRFMWLILASSSLNFEKNLKFLLENIQKL